MSKIVFFSIPAYGHTNPTVEVVRELVKAGHQVRYYSFTEFKEVLEGAGAEIRICDDYLPPVTKDVEDKIGKDFSALVDMVVDTTLKMDEAVCSELRAFHPDCIVSDSMCFWGKLFAKKLSIPYICSTTTFAFNQYTARMIKRSFKEMFQMIKGLKKTNEKIKQLNTAGYQVKSMIELMENNNDTDTIVYTSSAFQPMSETFSDRVLFVGPSIKEATVKQEAHEATVYISLGTVNSRQQEAFFKNCILALKDSPYKVIMSVGEATNLSSLGAVPSNFKIEKKVDQINTLVNTDVFLTHCGMNSANESMYFGVPVVTYPQQSEQGAVAARLEELGAGLRLKGNSPKHIRQAIDQVIKESSYKERTKQIGLSFRKAGGPKAAADSISKIAATVRTHE